MISVDEAIQLVIGHTIPRTITLPLQACAGHVLAQDILSPGPSHFDQSAMDGLCFCFADWQQIPLPVDGEMPQDNSLSPSFRAPPEGFYRSKIPPGADTNSDAGTRTDARRGHTYRKLNIDSRVPMCANRDRRSRPESVPPSGHTLQAAGIGFLASMGFDRATVLKSL